MDEENLALLTFQDVLVHRELRRIQEGFVFCLRPEPCIMRLENVRPACERSRRPSIR